MYDDVLLPTDGSDGTDEALEHARRVGERVHLLHVVDRRLYLAADEDEQEGMLDDLREEGRAALDDAAAAVDGPVETVLREGVPFREILAYAEAAGIGVVVMGSHGRTGREKRVNLGSTTERVVKEADRPVFVVDIGEVSP